MKVDFGTQVDGLIIDCAWTMSFDPQFDPLLEAAREATNTGTKTAGIDSPLNEVRAKYGPLLATQIFCHATSCDAPQLTGHMHTHLKNPP